MIYKALEALQKELNEFLDIRLGTEHDNPWVEISSLVDTNGALQFTKTACTLVSIEEETVARSNTTIIRRDDGTLQKVNPEIKLNFYILFSSHGEGNYDEAIKSTACIVQFFQQKNVFTPQNTPSLSDTIEKLIVELTTLSFEQQNHIWGMLGSKYMPSVFYKVRMLVIQEETPLEGAGAIRITEENYGSK